jgi:CheY-like chemotaxis protein
MSNPPPDSIHPAPGTPLGGRRVLVVEDDWEAAKLLADLLGHLGAEVEAIHDPRQAIGALRRARFDAVILDLGMPHLGGFQVAVRIRNQDRFDGVRIVALTGWDSAEDRARSQELGFHRHLIKPVEAAALIEALS